MCVMVATCIFQVWGWLVNTWQKKHWEAVNGIMRYHWKEQKDLCICIGKQKASVIRFMDAAYHADCRKFTSGYVFTFTIITISCISRLHKCVALSTIWTNYVVAAKPYTKGFKSSRSSQIPWPILLSGSQSSITLAWNLVYHARMKHIHMNRDVLNNKGIEPFKEHKDDNSMNHIFPKRLNTTRTWMGGSNM